MISILAFNHYNEISVCQHWCDWVCFVSEFFFFFGIFLFYSSVRVFGRRQLEFFSLNIFLSSKFVLLYRIILLWSGLRICCLFGYAYTLQINICWMLLTFRPFKLAHYFFQLIYSFNGSWLVVFLRKIFSL